MFCHLIRSPGFVARRGAMLLALAVIGGSATSARTWSDDSGKFSIEADLVSTENGEVTLKRADGKLLHLPIEKLSRADQDFLAKKLGDSPANTPLKNALAPSVEAPAATDPGEATSASRVNLKRDAKQIAATEQAVNELYKADLASAKAPQQRTDVARKMIQISATEPDAKAKYVLARKGAELAASVGNTHMTFAGMSGVEATCDDPLPVWIDGLEILLAHNPDDLVLLTEKIDALIADAVAKDNFAAAAKLASMTTALARLSKEPAQMASAKIKVAEVAAAKEEARKFATAQEQLKKNPEDAAAKATAGRYLCLVRRDWDRGLPLLSESNDKVLQPIAAAELQGTKAAADLATLGDSWIAAAKKMPLRLAAQDRALYWYRQALPSASGLTKIKIERELAGHELKIGMDLISRLDLEKDVALGKWALEGHALVVNSTSNEFNKITFSAPADLSHYRLLIELTAKSADSGGVMILLPMGNRSAAVALGTLDNRDFLPNLDGPSAHDPKNTTSVTPSNLNIDERSIVAIDVLAKAGDGEIQVEVNKRKIIAWKGPIAQFKAVDEFWAPPHPERIGISIPRGYYIFHSIRLICGKPTPSADPANH